MDAERFAYLKKRFGFSTRVRNCVACGKFIARNAGYWSETLGGWRCDDCYHQAVSEL